MQVTEIDNHAVEVRNVSGITKKENVMLIPLGFAAFTECHKEWTTGKSVQHAFPTLNADQREFLLSGMTPEEWDATFGKED